MIASKLKEILLDEIFLKFENKFQKNSLKVVEYQNENSNRLGEFTIVDLPKDSIAFSLDHNHSPELKKKVSKDGSRKYTNERCRNFSWLLKENHPDAGKKSDFVLIFPEGEDINVIIGELKSGTISKNECQIQLENSRLIVKYIIDILEEFHISKRLKIKYRLVVFSNSRKISRLIMKKYQYNGSRNVPLNLNQGNILISFIEVKNKEDRDFKDIFEKIKRNVIPLEFVKTQVITHPPS